MASRASNRQVEKPIPEGWDVLGNSAGIKEGDKFWDKKCQQWLVSSGVGRITETAYIRRITPDLPDPGPDHRIASGEDWRDERCEMWVGMLNDGFWDGRNHTGEPFLEGNIYRVPIAPAYRPFRDAEEFKPHAMRLWRWKIDSPDTNRMPRDFDDQGHYGGTWKESHEDKIFADDGSPFGVKVSP